MIKRSGFFWGLVNSKNEGPCISIAVYRPLQRFCKEKNRVIARRLCDEAIRKE